MGKVIKLLIKVFAGNDSWIKTSEFLTVVRVETTIIYTSIWNPFLTHKDTISERPNMTPFRDFRKLCIYTFRHIVNDISKHCTTACEVFPCNEIIVFLCKRVNKLFDCKLWLPSSCSMTFNSSYFFTALSLVPTIPGLVCLIKRIQETLLKWCGVFNFFFIHGRWIAIC